MADITITLNKEVSSEEMVQIESHISNVETWVATIAAYDLLLGSEFSLYYESMGGKRLTEIQALAQETLNKTYESWGQLLSSVENAQDILNTQVTQATEIDLSLVPPIRDARQAVHELRELEKVEQILSGFLKSGKSCSLQDWGRTAELTDHERVGSANTVWNELNGILHKTEEITPYVQLVLLIAAFDLGYVPGPRPVPAGITKEFLDGIELTVVGTTCYNPRFAKKREERVKSKLEEGLEAIKGKIPTEEKPVKTLTNNEVMTLVDQITMYRSVLAPRYTHLVSDHLRRVVGGKLNKALGSLQYHRHRHTDIIQQLHPSFFDMEIDAIRVDLSSVFGMENTVMDGVRELVELAGMLERHKSIWRNMRMVNHTYRREAYESQKKLLDEAQAYFDELEYKSQSISRHSDPTLKDLNVPLLAYMFLVSEGIRLI